MITSAKKQIVASLVSMVIFFLPATSIAVPVTYFYTGIPFEELSIINDYPPGGSYTGDDKVDVTLTTVDGCLPNSTIIFDEEFPDFYSYTMYDATPYVASWEMTDGRVSISNINADSFHFEASVYDDNIVAWFIRSERFIAPVGSPDTLEYRIYSEWVEETYLGAEPIDLDYGYIGWITNTGINFDRAAVNKYYPNDWTRTPCCVPEPSASFLILLSVIIGTFHYRKELRAKFSNLIE